MKGTRLLAGVLVVLVAAVAAFALGGRGGGGDDDRPDHLVTIATGTVDAIEVRAPATGRTGRLVRGDAGLRAIEADLDPLLAIRTFDRRLPAYGLDPARLDVVIRAGSRSVHLLVGTTNVDGTGVYVAVGGRTALVLPAIATALGDAVGQ
jgi:hypothetical protein